MAMMDQVKKNLREWYTLAADRTGEMAKISARRYDKFGLSREIERQLSELGSVVYHAIEEGRSDIADDPAVQQLVARVKELGADLERKEEEIDEIRRVRQQKQAEAAARQEAE